MSSTSEGTLPSYDITPVGDPSPLQSGDTTEAAVDGYTRWGTVRGNGIFNVNFNPMGPGNSNSHVFVSVSELNAEGFRFMGGARMLVGNVVVFPAGSDPNVIAVSVKLTVEWPAPLFLRLDYLVVNS